LFFFLADFWRKRDCIEWRRSWRGSRAFDASSLDELDELDELSSPIQAGWS
jgi:hypothetical protein